MVPAAEIALSRPAMPTGASVTVPQVKQSVNHRLVDRHSYLRAVELFNEANFFEAHEAWEDIWRASAEPEKRFLQGLIQVAVALHHHSTGNLAGAKSLLARGSRNLSGYPDDFCGTQVAALLGALAEWQRALAEGQPVPPLPTLKSQFP